MNQGVDIDEHLVPYLSTINLIGLEKVRQYRGLEDWQTPSLLMEAWISPESTAATNDNLHTSLYGLLVCFN